MVHWTGRRGVIVRVFFWLLVVVLLGGCVGTFGPSRPETVAVADVYSGAACGSEERGVAWLDDAAAVAAYRDRYGPGAMGAASPADRVDFARRGVVAVSLGQRPTAGYGLTLAGDRATVESDTLILRVALRRPAPGAFTAQMITRPCLMVAVPRDRGRRLRVEDDSGRVYDTVTR